MEDIIDKIQNPYKLGRQEADILEELRDKYPYFQAVHILIAKCHKNQNTFGFNKNLKLASLYAGDRKVLYNFINSEPEPVKELKPELVVVNEISSSVENIQEIETKLEPPNELIDIENVNLEIEKNPIEQLKKLIEDNALVLDEVAEPFDKLIEETKQGEISKPIINEPEIETSSLDILTKIKPPDQIQASEMVYPFEWKEEDIPEVLIEKEPEIELPKNPIFEVVDKNQPIEASAKNEEKAEEPETSYQKKQDETIGAKLNEEILNISNLIEELEQEIESEIPENEITEESVVELNVLEMPAKDVLIDEVSEMPFLEKGEISEENFNIDPILNEVEVPENISNEIIEEEKEKETTLSVTSKNDEKDFYSWLDNFALDETKQLTDVKSEEKEFALSDKKDAKIPGSIDDDLSINLPLNFDNEGEDEEFDLATMAEIAYDIQAFVKHPEPEEKELVFAPKQISKHEIEDLLDKFIKRNPTITRPKAEFYKPENMAKKSEEFHADVVSETLAQLFYKQGQLHKSLETYEKLMLQNPDKKDIFAPRIKAIKEELINQL
ncbi:MAG: hypothetical protein ACKVQB_00875 [Bacteroidia bacterium]